MHAEVEVRIDNWSDHFRDNDTFSRPLPKCHCLDILAAKGRVCADKVWDCSENVSCPTSISTSASIYACCLETAIDLSNSNNNYKHNNRNSFCFLVY